MRFVFVFCLSFMVIGGVNSQSKPIDTVAARKSLMAAADSMGAFFIRRDIQSYARYVHPKVVKSAGGEKVLVVFLDSSMKSMQAQGVEFRHIKVDVGSKLFTSGKELQCYLVQTLELKVPKGKLVATSYLIAISEDEGKRRYFFDTSNHPIDEVRQILPEINKEMVLPGKQLPVFYSD